MSCQDDNTSCHPVGNVGPVGIVGLAGPAGPAGLVGNVGIVDHNFGPAGVVGLAGGNEYYITINNTNTYFSSSGYNDTYSYGYTNPPAPISPSSGVSASISTTPSVRSKLEQTDRVDLREETESLQCSICMENRKNVVYTACSHLECCISCTKEIVINGNNECPLCRTDINDIVIIYT